MRRYLWSGKVKPEGKHIDAKGLTKEGIGQRAYEAERMSSPD